MEKIILIGTLGRDAEVKEINGKQYACLDIACDAGKDTAPTWYSVLRSVSTPEAAKLWRKGAMLYIEGRPRYKTYLDKMHNARVDVSIMADYIQVTRFAPEGDNAPASAPATPATPKAAKPAPKAAPAEDDDTDGLPF